MLGNFCDHIESLWHDPHSIVWQAGKKHCDCFDTHSEWNPSLGLQTGENSAHYVRRKISSAELGLVLIGSKGLAPLTWNMLMQCYDWVHECWMDGCIKGGFEKHLEVCYAYSQILCWCQVCQDSGKLQLVNATGALDVMIPVFSVLQTCHQHIRWLFFSLFYCFPLVLPKV